MALLIRNPFFVLRSRARRAARVVFCSASVLLVSTTSGAALREYRVQFEPSPLSSASPTTGYTLHIGPETGNYSLEFDLGAPPVQGGTVIYAVDLEDSVDLFVALRAYDVRGMQSVFSNELRVAAILLPPPPSGSGDDGSSVVDDPIDPNDLTDSDGDGIPDALESNTADADGDGIVDSADNDDDNDGIPNIVEAGADPANPIDSDGDGIPDTLDADSDNDGIPDVIEAGAVPAIPADTDGDGIPNYLDVDSDGDGLPDRLEDALAWNDADNDGIDDAYDVDVTGGLDLDLNGIDDQVTPIDPDNDGLPSYLDPDSDGDGIGDTAESNMTGVDSDGDGIDDALDPQITGGFDVDGDGIDDAYRLPDSDGDMVPDLDDLDSDNDGINDVIEAGLVDANDDGFADASQAITNSPPDTDGDGVPDYRDLDFDNDGIFDIDDALLGNLDADGDGRIDSMIDPDEDGIVGEADGDPFVFGNSPDTDLDGIADSSAVGVGTDGVSNSPDSGNSGGSGSGSAGPWMIGALTLLIISRRRRADAA